MVPQPRAEILTWIARFTGLAAFGASLGQTVVLWISLAGSSSIAILILISSMVFGLLAGDMIRRWFFSDSPNSRHQSESFISAMIPMAALSLAMIALSWTAPELMQVMNQTGSRLIAADSSTVSEQIFSSSSAALLLPASWL